MTHSQMLKVSISSLVIYLQNHYLAFQKSNQNPPKSTIMDPIHRLIWYPNLGLLKPEQVTEPGLVYDDHIKTTKHDIDVARILLFHARQKYKETIQRGAKALALAELALKAKEQEFETMKYTSLFERGEHKPTKGKSTSEEVVIERRGEDSELEDLRRDIDMWQRRCQQIQENFAWDIHGPRCFEVRLVEQLHRLVKERDEQMKGDVTADEKLDSSPGTCDGVWEWWTPRGGSVRMR